jgi:non-ribosomal peptide synthetase component E (peptide arylation enzyme)
MNKLMIGILVFMLLLAVTITIGEQTGMIRSECTSYATVQSIKSVQYRHATFQTDKGVYTFSQSTLKPGDKICVQYKNINEFFGTVHIQTRQESK